MIVLHHAWASTCSQKVRLCLAEKGLAWEGRVLNLRRFDHLTPEFLALNPDGFVPVLVDDGFVVRESSVINEYLDDSRPAPPLRPADARGRARVGEWTRFADEVASPAIKWPSFARNLAPALRTMDPAELEAVTARMPDPAVAERWRRAGRGDLDAEAIARSHGRLRLMLDRAEAALGATRWLAGEHYTLADIALVPFVARVEAFEQYGMLRSWPHVAAWLAAIRARPAFAEAGFVEQARTLDQAPA